MGLFTKEILIDVTREDIENARGTYANDCMVYRATKRILPNRDISVAVNNMWVDGDNIYFPDDVPEKIALHYDNAAGFVEESPHPFFFTVTVKRPWYNALLNFKYWLGNIIR